ncbi:asparaginase [Corynebacterium camporealensis]|uniref:asparaginase n=1 Tax=Corynebacterium camporealensis TaxID=161896 RepID=UPI0034CE8EAC
MTIALIATGGTIACTAADDGSLVPTVSGAQLAASVSDATDESSAAVDIEVVEFRQLDSSSITLSDLDDLLAEVHRQLERTDINGVVTTHGTDSMEETALALSLFSPGTKPVVLTGAQRAFDHPHGDGPANLRAAVELAAGSQPGVFVQFGGMTIPGHAVRKQHTSNLQGFEELDVPAPARTLPLRPLAKHPVTILAAYPGAEATLVDAAAHSFAGIIVEALGSGNTSEEMGTALARALDAGVPVVISTRVPNGPTTLAYGGAGGGSTLGDEGADAAGMLRPGPARIALAASLATGVPFAELFESED